MLKLSIWESFLVQAVVSFLSILKGKLTNPTELAALQAAIEFLEALVGTGVSVA